MESVKSILKESFKGTIIEDSVLEPYFITNSAGCFTVSKKRLDKDGQLRFSDICYPSTFVGCLNRIAKEKLHEEGKVFTSITEYREAWEKVATLIIDTYRDWEINL